MAKRKPKQHRPALWTTATFVFLMTFRGKVPSIPDAIKAMVRFCNALHKQAVRNQWEGYQIQLFLSNRDPYTGRKVRLHIHALLTARPGSECFKWINRYWYKSYGQVRPDIKGLQSEEDYGYYCHKQSLHSISRNYGIFRHQHSSQAAPLAGSNNISTGNLSSSTVVDPKISDNSNTDRVITVDLTDSVNNLIPTVVEPTDSADNLVQEVDYSPVVNNPYLGIAIATTLLKYAAMALILGAAVSSCCSNKDISSNTSQPVAIGEDVMVPHVLIAMAHIRGPGVTPWATNQNNLHLEN